MTNEKRIKELRAAFAELSPEHVERHVYRIEFFTMGGWDGEPETIGVNWSAIGTVDAATAREFGELLIAAADMIDEQ